VSSTYLDAASLAFGSSEFTVEEFRHRIGTPRAAKLLHELKSRGLVEKTGRGKYRLLSPAERPDLRRAEWNRVRNVILEAPFEMAWSGPTAVEKWTHGRYKLAPSPFAREFHIVVSKDEIENWRSYLSGLHIPLEPRRHIGPRVVLEAREKIHKETVDDEPVIPKHGAIKLVRSKPALYAGAEELLVG
jgi:hypothetical protein